MQLLQPCMPNEYFIHVICLLIFPTETVWSMFGITNLENVDINMYDLSDLPNKVTYCNRRTEMVFNDTEDYKFSYNDNIVNFISTRPVGDH